MTAISAFGATEEQGFFIDREDLELVAEVSPVCGDVVLSETSQEGGVDTVCVPAEAVEGFELRHNNGTAVLLLRFRRGDRVLEHVIGEVGVDLSAEAEAWLVPVNRLYAGGRREATPSAQPLAPASH